MPPLHVFPLEQLSLVSHWRFPTQWPWLLPWSTQRCHSSHGLSSLTVHGTGSGSGFEVEFRQEPRPVVASRPPHTLLLAQSLSSKHPGWQPTSTETQTDSGAQPTLQAEGGTQAPPLHVFPSGQLSLVSHWRSPTQRPWLLPWSTQRCHNSHGLSSPTGHETGGVVEGVSGSTSSSLQATNKENTRTRESKAPRKGVFLFMKGDLFFAISENIYTYLCRQMLEHARPQTTL